MALQPHGEFDRGADIWTDAGNVEVSGTVPTVGGNVQGDLDALLDASGPQIEEPEELGLVVAEMVVAASREDVARRRRRRRAVGLGSTAVLLAVGGTTAAATGIWTAPWSDEPMAVATYTLPSGSVCEERFSDLTTTDPAAAEPIREWLADQFSERTLNQIVDVDAAVPEARALGRTYTSDGTGLLPAGTYDVGYGTPYYDPDHEYFVAMHRALDATIADRLAQIPGLTSQGFDTGPSELHCTGPNQHPAFPWWVGAR